MSIETRISRLVKKTGVKKSRWTVPLRSSMKAVSTSSSSRYPLCRIGYLPHLPLYIERSEREMSTLPKSDWCDRFQPSSPASSKKCAHLSLCHINLISLKRTCKPWLELTQSLTALAQLSQQFFEDQLQSIS